nr:hypothetical protein BaRGS_022631 [Batillaria attramentaria]
MCGSRWSRPKLCLRLDQGLGFDRACTDARERDNASLSRGISEGNDQTAERGAATEVGYSSLDREHPAAMKDCCA